jgi:hypothetical protein
VPNRNIQQKSLERPLSGRKRVDYVLECAAFGTLSAIVQAKDARKRREKAILASVPIVALCPE